MAGSLKSPATVRVAHTIAETREAVAAARRAGKTIGLVPTMGALHAGHASLIEMAARECGCCIVSIFVNPIQFNDAGDYKAYPRTLETDAALCDSLGTQLIFAPSIEEMYPAPLTSFVDVEAVSEHLCGKFRPGHFRGVATVVMKLFQIVQPDRAYFGEKDAQQLAVIRRMVRDLNVPVEIVGAPTVRETDGLAMSSRNERLSAEERAVAPVLYRALRRAAGRIDGGARDATKIREEAIAALGHPMIRVEYLDVVDAESMQPVERVQGAVRVAAAIFLGSTRLIDNVAAHRIDGAG